VPLLLDPHFPTTLIPTLRAYANRILINLPCVNFHLHLVHWGVMPLFSSKTQNDTKKILIKFEFTLSIWGFICFVFQSHILRGQHLRLLFSGFSFLLIAH